MGAGALVCVSPPRACERRRLQRTVCGRAALAEGVVQGTLAAGCGAHVPAPAGAATAELPPAAARAVDRVIVVRNTGQMTILCTAVDLHIRSQLLTQGKCGQ